MTRPRLRACPADARASAGRAARPALMVCAAALTGCALTACGLAAHTRPTEDPLRTVSAAGDHHTRLQRDIADCMAKAGFTYLPYEPPDPNSLPVLAAQRRRFGFFLFARFAGLLDASPLTAELTAPDNPNRPIVSSLAPGRRDRYLNALYGSPAAAPAGRIGCQQAAETADAPSRANLAQWRSIQARYYPALARSLNAYASCLRAKGFTVTHDPQQVIQAVYDTERAALVRATRQRRISRNAARAGMQREIAAALDDLACGETWYQLHDAEVNAFLG